MSSINIGNEIVDTVKRTGGIRRAMLCVCCACLFIAVFTTGAFADTYYDYNPWGTVSASVKTASQSIYNILLAVILPVGAICVGTEGFRIMFGGEKGMEKAGKRLLVIVIAMMIIYLAPTIIVFAQSLIPKTEIVYVAPNY